MRPWHIVAPAAACLLVATTVAVRSAADRAKPGDVNEARVLAEAASGVNWLVGGGTFGSINLTAASIMRTETQATP